MTRSPWTPNAGALRYAAAAAAAAVGAATAFAVACIPDLPPDLAPDSGEPASSSGSTPAHCGDGYIDLAAGEQCDPGPAGSGIAVGGCNPDCTMQCSPDAGFLWLKNNHCYEIAAKPATRLLLGADRQVCGVLPGNAHVVTFASEEEFRSVARNVDAGWFWVGLEETTNNDDYTSLAAYEPGWAPPCTGCYAHNPAPTMGLPRSNVAGTGGPYCVQASSDLGERAWQMVPCSGLNPGLRVVCEREPVGSQARACEAGTCIDLVWTLGAKSYVYGAAASSADAAEFACRGLGGRLAVLGSRDEREQLWKELGKLTLVPTAVWIGLSQGGGRGPGDGGATDAGATGDGAAANVWTWDDDASGDAYPSPWGFDRPTPSSNHSTRAYLTSEQPALSDDTLARNDGPMPAALPYVCELLLDAGAPGGGDP